MVRNYDKNELIGPKIRKSVQDLLQNLLLDFHSQSMELLSKCLQLMESLSNVKLNSTANF